MPAYRAVGHAQQFGDLGGAEVKPVGQHDHRLLPDAQAGHGTDDIWAHVRQVHALGGPGTGLPFPPLSRAPSQRARLAEDRLVQVCPAIGDGRPGWRRQAADNGGRQDVGGIAAADQRGGEARMSSGAKAAYISASLGRAVPATAASVISAIRG